MSKLTSRQNKLAKKASKISTIELKQQHIEAYQGPLPPPAMLAQYGEVVSNGAERIFAMAEKEQEARLKAQDQEQARQDRIVDIQERDINSKIKGRWLAYILLAGFSVVAMYLSVIGAPYIYVATCAMPPLVALIEGVISVLKSK